MCRIVWEMERKRFLSLLKKIGELQEPFGSLVLFGASRLSMSDKSSLQTILSQAGIPADAIDTDEKLESIAHAIMARAVKLE